MKSHSHAILIKYPERKFPKLTHPLSFPANTCGCKHNMISSATQPGGIPPLSSSSLSKPSSLKKRSRLKITPLCLPNAISVTPLLKHPIVTARPKLQNAA